MLEGLAGVDEEEVREEVEVEVKEEVRTRNLVKGRQTYTNITPHPPNIRTLRNRHDPTLYEPTYSYLCRVDVVRFDYLGVGGVGEECWIALA